MKRFFKRLKNAPVYLKIIAALVIATALVIAIMSDGELVYYRYVWKKESKYPWISGGTVVTYSEAPNGTWTLRVSPRTGKAPYYLPTQNAHKWWDDIGIAQKGQMRNYYQDIYINDPSSIYLKDPPWYWDMNRYFYYEKNGDSSLIKSFHHSLWNLEKPKVTGVVIDEGVTHIGDYAFYRRYNGREIPDPNYPLPAKYLESVLIANSVEYIGESAFERCGSLPSLTIPDGVKWIGKRAFYDCAILSPVTIPKSVEYIGEEAFEGTVHIDVAADNPKYSSIDGVLFNKKEKGKDVLDMKANNRGIQFGEELSKK